MREEGALASEASLVHVGGGGLCLGAALDRACGALQAAATTQEGESRHPGEDEPNLHYTGLSMKQALNPDPSGTHQ